VLWYAASHSEHILEANQRKRGRVAENTTMRRLKELTWFDVRPASVWQSDEEEERRAVLPDVEVRRLDRERRDKVEAVRELLETRFPEVPAEVLWHVEDALDLANVEDLARRAATVRDPRELLPRT
jgi:hypothetical protein